MKFGGTSVADAERIKRAARRIVAQRDSGKRVVAVLSARGKTTDELIAMAEEVSPDPDPREMDMLLSTGERISCALCAMAINDLGHRRHLADRLAGGHRDRHLAHQGADPRRARRPHQAGAGRGPDRARRRISGRIHQPRRDHARAGRLGHDRRRGGGGDRRRGLRDLHRRSRACSAPTRGSCRMPASCRRSASRRCWRWRPAAPRCCSCARSSTRAPTACGSTVDPASTSRPVPLSSEKTRPWNIRSSPLSPTPPTRRGSRWSACPTGLAPRRRSSGAGRGQLQRRHDHPERAADRRPCR